MWELKKVHLFLYFQECAVAGGEKMERKLDMDMGQGKLTY